MATSLPPSASNKSAEVPNPGGEISPIPPRLPRCDHEHHHHLGALQISRVWGCRALPTFLLWTDLSENDNGLNINRGRFSLNMLLGQNQIQEATIVNIGYSGQFGGAAGANMNFITKSWRTKKVSRQCCLLLERDRVQRE